MASMNENKTFFFEQYIHVKAIFEITQYEKISASKYSIRIQYWLDLWPYKTYSYIGMPRIFYAAPAWRHRWLPDSVYCHIGDPGDVFLADTLLSVRIWGIVTGHRLRQQSYETYIHLQQVNMFFCAGLNKPLTYKHFWYSLPTQLLSLLYI